MKKVYSLKDLADEVGLKSSGYRINVRPGIHVGLYDDIFNVHFEGGRIEEYAPGKIIPAVKEILEIAPTTQRVTDSKLFDLAWAINDKVDEEEYFEMDLGDDPVATVNKWLTEYRIPVTVLDVNEVDDDIVFEVKSK